jgi:outer membrane protein
MKNTRLHLLLILMLTALSWHTYAEEVFLDLETCQRIALDTNPLSRAACEGVRIAKETTGIARAPYYPEVGFRAHYLRWQRHDFITLNDTTGALPPGILPSVIGPTNDYEYSVQSRWTLYDWGERRSRLMATLAEQGAACREAERTRQEIILGATIAFYNLIANRELEQVAIENLERAQKHHQLTMEKHAVGAAPLADVYRAQVEVAEGKQELVQVESLVRISKVNLNSAMGLPPNIPVDIEAAMEEPVSPQYIDLDAAQSIAVSCRPEIQSLKNQICSLKYRVRQAQSEHGPKISAQAGYGKRDSDWTPSNNEWRVGVTMEVPIFTGYAITHNVRRTKSELCKLKAEYDRLSLDVQKEVWISYSRLLEAYEMIQTSIAQVKDAKESMRLTEERYKAGAGIISDLLDAQTALTKADATHVDALWSYQSAQTVFIWTQGLLQVGSSASP